MKAAKRYAKALFELSSDQLDTVQKDMQLVQKTFKESPELAKIVKDPTIVASKKLNIATAVFGNKVSKNTQKLISLLGQKDRLSLLQDIAKAFDELYKKSKGIKDATVVTAVPLNDKIKESILQKIKEVTGSSHIKLNNTIDPAIIGGFILNMDDLRYDASISGKLAKIKSKLVE